MDGDTNEIAARYRKVAAQFGRRVDKVAPDGWVARDIVDHLATWLPGFFFGMWQIDAGPAPSDRSGTRPWAGPRSPSRPT